MITAIIMVSGFAKRMGQNKLLMKYNNKFLIEYTLNIISECNFKQKIKKDIIVIRCGGHIGLALFKIPKNLDFYTVVVDDREEFANIDRFENVDEIYAGDIDKIVENTEINDNTYVIIATRGYEGDLRNLRSVINRNANYIGMIGSRKNGLRLKRL